MDYEISYPHMKYNCNICKNNISYYFTIITQNELDSQPLATTTIQNNIIAIQFNKNMNLFQLSFNNQNINLDIATISSNFPNNEKQLITNVFYNTFKSFKENLAFI